MKNNFCYVHIPFCSSKCKYCRFASFGNLDNFKIDIYIKYLLNEIKNKKIDFKNLKSIYFGGGTPSILKINDLDKIIQILKNKYSFNKNIEINIEATPITITRSNIIGWKKIGINRLSIGIQTLNNDSLIEIGREEKGNILSALDNIKEIGFENVSLDFIIGLPNVGKGEIQKDIQFVLDNYKFIKHISVYMLEEYYYPGNWSKLSIGDDDYLSEYTKINNFLKNKGFNRYEISNYALKGYECKHNKAYWNHDNILAFGLGAHGFLNNTRYSNSEKFIEYYSGKQLIDDKLTQEDIFVEKIMFGLRTSGLSKSLYMKLNQEKIREFIASGHLLISTPGLKLVDKGILVIDHIIKELLP